MENKEKIKLKGIEKFVIVCYIILIILCFGRFCFSSESAWIISGILALDGVFAYYEVIKTRTTNKNFSDTKDKIIVELLKENKELKNKKEG